MAKHVNHCSRLMSFHKAAPLIVVLLGTAALNACSTVPDMVNPAEWYRGTVDFFAGGDKAKAKKGGEGKKESGLDKSKSGETLAVWFPSDLIEWINETSAKLGVSKSQFVTKILNDKRR